MVWSSFCVEVISCSIASCTCMPSSFTRCGRFSAVISLNKISAPFHSFLILGYQVFHVPFLFSFFYSQLVLLEFLHFKTLGLSPLSRDHFSISAFSPLWSALFPGFLVSLHLTYGILRRQDICLVLL